MLVIQDMPDEVILYIFGFLHLKDRKITRLVCKRWYSLSYSISLINKDIAVIRRIQELCDATQYVRHVNIIIKLDLQDFSCPWHENVLTAKFWRETGHFIKSLDFICNFVQLELLCDLFIYCPNLEKLTVLVRPDSEPLLGEPFDKFDLPKLTSLSLYGGFRSLLPLFKNIAKNSSQLEFIKLHLFTTASDRKSVFEDEIIELIHPKDKKLKILDVSNCDVNDGFIMRLIEFIGPQFFGLSIECCQELTDRSLEAIEEATNLKQLFLGDCNFNLGSFRRVFFSLKQLTVVSLYNSLNVTDTHMTALAALSNLSRLDLSGCRRLTDVGIYQVFGQKIRPQMIELRLRRVRYITDGLIFQIAPNLPELRILCLQMTALLTEKSLEIICNANIRLRCLTVEGFDLYRTFKLTPSINSLLELTHLNVHLSSNNKSSELLKSLKLPMLKVLDIDSRGDDSEEVMQMLTDCPSLRYVNCSHLFERNYFPYVKVGESFLQCHDSPFGSCYG